MDCPTLDYCPPVPPRSWRDTGIGKAFGFLLATLAPFAFVAAALTTLFYMLFCAAMAGGWKSSARVERDALWFWLSIVIPVLAVVCAAAYAWSGWGYKRVSRVIYVVAAYLVVHGICLPRAWLPGFDRLADLLLHP